jgi:hypothetical protein
MENQYSFENERYFSSVITILNNLSLTESPSKTKNKVQRDAFLANENRKVRLAIIDIENILPNAKVELENFYLLREDLRNDGYKYLMNRIYEIEKILSENILTNIESRKQYLSILKNLIEDIFLKVTEVVSIIKLKIEAPKNVVYDLFRQLKVNTIKDKTKILSQSYDDLALFLHSYVEGFENISIKTIAKELSREQSISKARIEIRITS